MDYSKLENIFSEVMSKEVEGLKTTLVAIAYQSCNKTDITNIQNQLSRIEKMLNELVNVVKK